MSREELQLEFETFIFRNFHHAVSEKAIAARTRLINANVYFCEHAEFISYHKVCELMLKAQDLMIQILPPTKDPEYNKSFSKMNDIVRWAKEATKKLEEQYPPLEPTNNG